LLIDKIALEAEIAQRIRVEEKLQQSETRFHSLFELTPLPVLLTEFESGKIVDTNLAIYELTGFSKEALLGKTTYEMGFIKETLRNELYGILSRNEQVLAFETTINIKGKPRIAHLFMSMLIIGQEKFIVTLISDITNQKETEQRLKELNLTKDKFFSIIAHDLVNPFHAMILYSNELKVFTAGNERASSYNTNLLLTAQNTYNLLQNLLTWSRTQTKQISFNPQLFNLGDIITENVSSARNIAKSKQIDIINEADPDILIEADLQMINLILRNLISNSIKFSFNQGMIKILSQVDESQIRITVIDNGTGMDSQELGKLFDLFQTDQRPGTAGEAGTGLGLVICSEFASCHGGSIQVESEPGKGSSFTVTLPKKQK
jgi:PAS domain S-box-containing protein